MKNESNNGGTHDAMRWRTGQCRANREDVAWLAGAFDGEGTVGIRRWVDPKGNHTTVMSIKAYISNCNVEFMEKFQRIAMDICHKKFSIVNHSFTGGKRCFSLTVGDQRSVRLVCGAMMPYLTVKRAQAELAIAFCESRKQNRHRGTSYSEWELGAVEEMRRLKDIGFTSEPYLGRVESERLAPVGEVANA
jgi:hypothetical protein